MNSRDSDLDDNGLGERAPLRVVVGTREKKRNHVTDTDEEESNINRLSPLADHNTLDNINDQFVNRKVFPHKFSEYGLINS